MAAIFRILISMGVVFCLSASSGRAMDELTDLKQALRAPLLSLGVPNPSMKVGSSPASSPPSVPSAPAKGQGSTSVSIMLPSQGESSNELAQSSAVSPPSCDDVRDAIKRQYESSHCCSRYYYIFDDSSLKRKGWSVTFGGYYSKLWLPSKPAELDCVPSCYDCCPWSCCLRSNSPQDEKKRPTISYLNGPKQQDSKVIQEYQITFPVPIPTLADGGTVILTKVTNMTRD